MDEELKHLRNRFFLGLAVSIIFLIPLIIFVVNKFGSTEQGIIKTINTKEDILLLVIEENCKSCQNIKKILKDKDVIYLEINKDRENNFQEILRKIDMVESDITPPTLIYLKEGKLYSSLVDPSDNEITTYIDTNELSSSH